MQEENKSNHNFYWEKYVKEILLMHKQQMQLHPNNFEGNFLSNPGFVAYKFVVRIS